MKENIKEYRKSPNINRRRDQNNNNNLVEYLKIFFYEDQSACKIVRHKYVFFFLEKHATEIQTPKLR